MLRPERKIIKKEIKKDPLLETLDKIESGFEKNKKVVTNVFIILVVILIGSVVLINKQRSNDKQSNSALGLAMVAYSNSDYENAKFQFENIAYNFEGTKGEILSNYYLGKIAYERKNFSEAENFLNKFLEYAEDVVLVSGATKQLIDIAFQNKNYNKIFQIVDQVKKFDLDNFAIMELDILEIKAFLALNDIKNAKIRLDKLLLMENHPNHIKQKIEEFSGIL